MATARTTPKPRENLKPKATAGIIAAAVAVTNRTSAVMLGLDDRDFRKLLIDHKVPHVRLGRLVIATVANVVVALEKAAKAPNVDPAPADEGDEEEDDGPRDVSALLAKAGRRRS